MSLLMNSVAVLVGGPCDGRRMPIMYDGAGRPIEAIRVLPSMPPHLVSANNAAMPDRMAKLTYELYRLEILRSPQGHAMAVYVHGSVESLMFALLSGYRKEKVDEYD